MNLIINLPLAQTLEHFFVLYGPVNQILFRDVLQPVAFLSIAVNDLENALRRGRDRETLEFILARIFCRIATVIEKTVGASEISRALATKYPYGQCAYCKQAICTCTEQHNEPQVFQPIAEQLSWSLGEWQKHGQSVYGAKNQTVGPFACLGRLHHEIAEIMGPVLSLSIALHQRKRPDANFKHEVATKIGDAIMWTIGISNLLNIDMETAIIARYGNGCWNCKQNPCQCSAPLSTNCLHT